MKNLKNKYYTQILFLQTQNKMFRKINNQSEKHSQIFYLIYIYLLKRACISHFIQENHYAETEKSVLMTLIKHILQKKLKNIQWMIITSSTSLIFIKESKLFQEDFKVFRVFFFYYYYSSFFRSCGLNLMYIK